MFAPASGLVYTDSYPVAVGRMTQGVSPSAIGPTNLSDADADITRYIHPDEGGEPGPVGTLGYSTGLNPGNMPQPLTGMAVRFPQTEANPDYGPVGRSYQDTTPDSGVAQMQAPPPDLATIYASLVRHG